MEKVWENNKKKDINRRITSEQNLFYTSAEWNVCFILFSLLCIKIYRFIIKVIPLLTTWILFQETIRFSYWNN